VRSCGACSPPEVFKLGEPGHVEYSSVAVVLGRRTPPLKRAEAGRRGAERAKNLQLACEAVGLSDRTATRGHAHGDVSRMSGWLVRACERLGYMRPPPPCQRGTGFTGAAVFKGLEGPAGDGDCALHAAAGIGRVQLGPKELAAANAAAGALRTALLQHARAQSDGYRQQAGTLGWGPAEWARHAAAATYTAAGKPGAAGAPALELIHSSEYLPPEFMPSLAACIGANIAVLTSIVRADVG
jgi:hypothetical protein